jgi:two-component system cell cycle sensor histidine kinase/response regulator CckA
MTLRILNSHTQKDPPLVVAINDQRDQLRLISQILQSSGIEVACFEDPMVALTSLAQLPKVDLIITDLNMPNLSGWELCNRLRSPEHAKFNETPILIVSATFSGLKAKEVRCELGVNDFLPVPYRPEQLQRKVADILLGLRPKARLNALFIGYQERSAEASCFRRFGYEVTTAVSLEDSLSHLDSQVFDVLIYRGELNASEAKLLFSPSPQLICSIWVVVNNNPDLTNQLDQVGVNCVLPDTRGEQLVRICETARQQNCLAKIRDLLEKRTLQLLSSEQKHRTLFQCIPDVVFCLDIEGNILDLNEAGCSQLGLTVAEASGKNLVEYAGDGHDEIIAYALAQTSRDGFVQYEVTLENGEHTLLAEVHQRKILLEGRPCILAIARDVGERRLYQQAVLASDTRYRIIAENTNDWEFWLGPHGFFLYSSPSAEKVTGYLSHDFEEDPLLLIQLVPPEERPQFERDWQLRSSADLPKDFEFRMVHRDGRIRRIHHLSTAVYDSHGNFLGSRGSHRDVTEMRIREEERNRLLTAIEQSSESILLSNSQGLIHYANNAFMKRSFSAGSATAMTTAQLQGDERWQEAHAQILERMSQGLVWSGTYSRRDQHSGINYELAATVSPVRDIDGGISNFVWVERDTTSEQQLAEQLRHSQKMEAIGTLAGGIAHDFNNLLCGILGYSGLIALQSENLPEIQHAAQVIERTARRAADLTQKLLGFARQGKHQNVSVCLHRAIQDSIELLSRTIDKRIQIVTQLDAEVSQIQGDPTQMEQILLNLAINARDAISDKGTITISTRYQEVCEPANEDLLQPGAYIVVAVSDTGCGIPPELQERVFEPFFTTKESGKGTGMGLAMVYGIVKNHGGHIRLLQSSPDQGTTFAVYLPANTKPTGKVKEVAPKVSQGAGCILVVDDEELLRDVAGRLLRKLGYDVLTACDGEDAVSVYTKNLKKVDAVIVDMIMPKMAGAECFRALKGLNPEVKAILSTGYSLNESAQNLLDEGMAGFIQKPYQLGQLSEVLTQILVPQSTALEAGKSAKGPYVVPSGFRKTEASTI